MNSEHLKTNDTKRKIPKRDVKNNRIDDLLLKEKETQTSKTIIQLAKLEIAQNKGDENVEAKQDLRFNRMSDVYLSSLDIPAVQTEKPMSLTKLYLSKRHQKNRDDQDDSLENSQIIVKEPERVPDKLLTVSEWSRFSIKEIRVKSINAPKFVPNLDLQLESTDNLQEIQENMSLNISSRLPTSRRGRSLSPPTHRDYINCVGNSTDELISAGSSESIKYKDFFQVLLSQIRSRDWNVSLKALVDLAEKANSFDVDRLYPHMTEINQRLIEFLRSPRSFVCRTACQIAGKLFEYVKDTRRPEFDDIVDLLLMKTADSNRFIRKDANCALDSLIMQISPFHSIRALSQKGPTHKNDLVRISTARLFVCIVGIATVNTFFNNSGNECTKKRIVTHMANFIKDKNCKTREYGIRLYKLIQDHPNYDLNLKKNLDKSRITEMMKLIKKYSVE